MRILTLTIMTFTVWGVGLFAQEHSTVTQTLNPSKMMPVDPYDKKNINVISTKLTSLGFKVGTIKKIDSSKWRVTLLGWDKKRASQSNSGVIDLHPGNKQAGGKCLQPINGKHKGSRSWDPTDTSKTLGKGIMTIEMNEQGIITLSQNSLKNMGLRANPKKIQTKFGLK